MDYYSVVKEYANKRYGKENIETSRKANEIGTLGATEFTLKDGNKLIAYFHYQLEKVCVLGEPWC
ncbi:hypothetical protein NPD5_3850 [Clostridium sporogenes]|uniref:Uncharacterized protein n=1 Tax=Clostridium sporogenes TaxID=1509 RepID=A0A1L3NBZ4_CLOSG|nr:MULTISPECIES: hypothetical protein [Clostridium]APH13642.1 hypothetical protein NPD5_3850 [Clostridium sporogenes]KEI90738.1 hypothetical protein N493_15130 [Clostridium botulinum B2 433]